MDRFLRVYSIIYWNIISKQYFAIRFDTEAPEIFEQASTTPDFLVPVFIFGFGLGWMLLGGMILKGAILPRWSGVFLIVGVGLFVLSESGSFETSFSHVLVTIGDIIFSLGLIGIGYNMFNTHVAMNIKSSASSV